MSEAEKDAFSAIKETKAPLHAQAAYTEQDLRDAAVFMGAVTLTEAILKNDFRVSEIAEELATKIAEWRREAVAGAVEACAKHRPYWKGLALVCACGKWTYASYTDKEGTKVQEQWEAHIRTLYPAATGELERRLAEARAGMREACANVIGNFKFLCEQNERAYASAKRLFSQAIRDVPDSSADEAIERIKREARLEARIDEWRDAVVYFLSADLHGNDIEKIKKYVKSHSVDLNHQLAALSGKET